MAPVMGDQAEIVECDGFSALVAQAAMKLQCGFHSTFCRIDSDVNAIGAGQGYSGYRARCFDIFTRRRLGYCHFQ